MYQRIKRSFIVITCVLWVWPQRVLQSRVLSSRHALNDAVFEEEYQVRDYAIHAPGGLVLELEQLTLSGRGNSVYMCCWCY